MSFNSHRQRALDTDLPISHRMSPLRSCAMLIGQNYDAPHKYKPQKHNRTTLATKKEPTWKSQDR